MNFRQSFAATSLLLMSLSLTAFSAAPPDDSILDIDNVPEEMEFCTLGPMMFTGRNGVSIEATLLATGEDGSILLRKTTGQTMRTKRSSLDAVTERRISDFEDKARREGRVRWHGYWVSREIG